MKIGIELGLSHAKLKIIAVDHSQRCEDCCNQMLAEWLQIDPTASWKKLFDAVESPTVYSGYTGMTSCIQHDH